MQKNSENTGGVLTFLSTLIIGILNAYSVVFNQSTLISAQTGNLINLGIKLSRGDLKLAYSNFDLLIGFAMGCIFASLMIKKNAQNYLYGWSVFSLIIWVNTLFQNSIDINLSILSFSFISGLALTLFRNFGESNLNNGIMTGNLKNMYVNATLSFKKREKQSKGTLKDIFVIVFTFFSGGVIGGFVCSFGKLAILTLTSILCVIPFALKIQQGIIRR
ncbi:YoaK family protein [Pediococcus ethanolidurans]|uniref:Uncharacterized membrane protein YoaK, UPF0700 family n=1 Tax=Pediococcus ethanolidurans TaxID=319653 RepID=A0A0R2K1Y6_9LACO|nr:YoaK family protein [Pediococcus ethanolidurans]KRN83633.1 hypothetical protein IV87_GL000102 [Pediococcus ethanolidurans]GEN94012.1 membrane protein [Pediococcus ethanolidurans]SER01797.1 Uncharacterized membrane protein YoaK, UPF0700 family [Pediococcus ethanolidurans]